MQKEINNNEYWEGKRLQEARESASKNAIGLMDIGERLGLLKDRYQTIEDFYDAYSGVVNQLCENILKGINLKAEFKTAKQDYAKGEAEAFAEKNYGHDGSATEKQCKAVWAIIYGRNGKPELEKELTVDKEHLNDLSFEEASDFIDKYGKFNK